MNVKRRIRDLVAEWQHGGSDGPSWDELMLKLAREIRLSVHQQFMLECRDCSKARRIIDHAIRIDD